MAVYTIDRDTLEGVKLRQRLVRFLEANDIDPADVTLDPVEVDGDVIAYRTFVLDGNGRRQAKPCCDRDPWCTHEREVWTSPATAPLRVPMEDVP